MFFFFSKNSRKYRGRFDVTFCLTNVSFRFYLESRGLTVNSFFGRTRFWRERIGTQFMMKWHFYLHENTFLRFDISRWSTSKSGENIQTNCGETRDKTQRKHEKLHYNHSKAVWAIEIQWRPFCGCLRGRYCGRTTVEKRVDGRQPVERSLTDQVSAEYLGWVAFSTFILLYLERRCLERDSSVGGGIYSREMRL